jgi:hypothetical protein
MSSAFQYFTFITIAAVIITGCVHSPSQPSLLKVKSENNIVKVKLAEQHYGSVPRQLWPPSNVIRLNKVDQDIVEKKILVAKQNFESEKIKQQITEVSNQSHQSNIVALKKIDFAHTINSEIDQFGLIDSANAVVTFIVRERLPAGVHGSDYVYRYVYALYKVEDD